MSSYNKVIVIGNLTRDPQVKSTTKGTSVCELGLAVNTTWFDKATNTKKEDTVFLDVVLWGRLADLAGEYLTKGKSVLIDGKLSQQNWDDKQTGQKRSKLVVVAENMQFLGGNESRGERSEQRPSRKPAEDVGDPVGQFPDDDVPF